MLSIRLKRIGKKKKPFYNIIISDKKKNINGRYIEKLGYFNPLNKNELKINKEKINYWISKGASLSKRISCLIYRNV